MAAVVGILLHDVGEIGGGDIEPLRQQPRDQQRHRRLVAQERRPHRRTRRSTELDAARTVAVCGSSSSTDISPSTAPGSVMHSDDGVALDHLEPSLDQDEQMAGLAAFMEDERARRTARLVPPLQ